MANYTWQTGAPIPPDLTIWRARSTDPDGTCELDSLIEMHEERVLGLLNDGLSRTTHCILVRLWGLSAMAPGAVKKLTPILSSLVERGVLWHTREQPVMFVMPQPNRRVKYGWRPGS